MGQLVGLIVSSQYIPPEDTLARYVQWAKLRKDGEDDHVVGVLPDAFVPRENERDLSASWLEFHKGARAEQISATVQTFRLGSMKPTPKSGFVLGNVAKISSTAEKHGSSIRVILEPEDDNPAHVGIHRWPRDNMDLFNELADQTWSEIVLNRDIP
jgi:hypothetical protein